MKKLLLTSMAMVVATGVFAQGTVVMNNRILGTLVTQVFAPTPGEESVQKVGNTAQNTPAGTQTYAGAALTGSGWTAQLWSVPGSTIPAGVSTPYGTIDASLVAALPTTTFRTGTAAGNVAGLTATLQNVAGDAAAAVIQLRVFPSSFGSWADAVAAYTANNPLAAIGASPMFVVNAIGGTLNPAPTLAGLQSFSLVTPGIIPEPTSFAIAGLGAAALLAFRRRN